MHFSDTNQWKAPTGLSIQRISTCKHKFTKIKNPQMCRDQIFWLNSFGSSIGYQVIFFHKKALSKPQKKHRRIHLQAGGRIISHHGDRRNNGAGYEGTKRHGAKIRNRAKMAEPKWLPSPKKITMGCSRCG